MPQLDIASFFQLITFTFITYILFYNYYDVCGRFFFANVNAKAFIINVITKNTAKITISLKKIYNSGIFKTIGLKK